MSYFLQCAECGSSCVCGHLYERATGLKADLERTLRNLDGVVGENDALKVEVARLIAERNELRRLDTLADMREAELEAALRKYGRHASLCDSKITRIKGRPPHPCTCGLDAALAGTKP